MKRTMTITILIILTTFLLTGTMFATYGGGGGSQKYCWYRGEYDCACDDESPGEGYTQSEIECNTVNDCRDQEH